MRIPIARILGSLLLVALLACQSDAPSTATANYQEVGGETMGTYYRLTYSHPEQKDFKTAVDSLLKVINLEVSTYIPASTISRFNQSEKGLRLDYNPATEQQGDYPNEHFMANLRRAQSIYQQSNGYFDPTVMPLVNYWGFGYTEKKVEGAVDSQKVEALKALVGMDKINVIRTSEFAQLTKGKAEVQLDFSAIAKGYAVDEIARLLAEQGVDNYLVDIGGEVVAKGKNAKGKVWQIGISNPQEGAEMADIQTAVPLADRALATSGNYRNFYEVDGVKYSHTISPKTGYPERNTLLSASVFAADCMTADAYATAFMTMGVEQAYELASALPEVEAYFIFGLPDGSMATRHTQGLNDIFATE